MTASPPQVTCPKCKASLPAKAKFCNLCGTKIAPPVVPKPEKPLITHRPDMTFAEFFEFAGQTAVQLLNSGKFSPHFAFHDQAGKPNLILVQGTKNNIRNSIIMGLMKSPWRYFVTVLDATARDDVPLTGELAAVTPVQTGMELFLMEGISRGGDYDAAIFSNGQRTEGTVESWGGGMALKNLYRQAYDYAAQPHADLHLNADKYGNAANLVVIQDPNFATVMWNAINEKNLDLLIDGVTQKAKTVAPVLTFNGEEIPEFAYEIFVRIVQNVPLLDDVKVPLASEIKSHLLKA
jgi:hypothetical protein